MKNGLQWFKGLGGLAKTLVIASGLFVGGSIVDAVSAPNQVDIQQADQQVQNVTTEVKTVTTTEVVPYEVEETETSNLNNGDKQVTQEGKNGLRTFIYEVTYEDGVEVNRVLQSNEITKKPVNKKVLVGTYVAPAPQATTTPSCDPNYTGGCVPVVSYDLNCPDIGFTVYVVGTDKHGFDRDGDGVGCESY